MTIDNSIKIKTTNRPTNVVRVFNLLPQSEHLTIPLIDKMHDNSGTALFLHTGHVFI